MDDWERYRLVVLGAGKVGKTSIISQFLGNKFEDKYKETVEDLHCREYNVNGHCIKVDILDTSGTLQFPAMRRLSISTAHAFLLVFSVDDRDSLEVVRQIYTQIREQRSNFDELPIVVVGNKTDRADFREVEEIDMHDLIVREGWKCSFVEVSALENLGILDIFQKLLQMAKIPVARELSPVLRRRMSEHGYKRRKDGRGSFKESDKEMSRSRSLMRRTGRPKVKQSQDPTKSDCVIS